MNTIAKSITAGSIAAAGLAAAVVGLAAPASAAPSAGNAEETISHLEAEGNRVIVNRLSDAPLADATVVAINKGGDIRSTVQDYSADRTFQQRITGSVFYVDVR